MTKFLASLFAALCIASVAVAGGIPPIPLYGVTAFGPITPGDCTKWKSVSQIQDALVTCNGGGTGSPGGTSGSVQWNNGGVFGGDTGFKTDGAGDLTETGTIVPNGSVQGPVIFNPTLNYSSTATSLLQPFTIVGAAIVEGSGANLNGNDTGGELFDTNWEGSGTWALATGLQAGMFFQTTATYTNTVDMKGHWQVEAGTPTITSATGVLQFWGGTIGPTNWHGYVNSNNSSVVTISGTNNAFENDDPNATISNAGLLAQVGTSTFTGAATFNGQIELGAGSAGTPSIAPANDLTTGLYGNGASSGGINFSCSGTRCFGINANAIFANNATGPSFENAGIGANPTLVVDRGDLHAGTGANTAGNLSGYADNSGASLEVWRASAAGFAVPSLVSCTGVQTSSAGLMSCVSSDARVKNDLGVISPANSNMPALHKFTYKPGYGPAGVHYGWFAQDVRKTHPELVRIGPKTKLTPDGTLQFDKSELLPLIIARQQTEIDELKKEVAALKTRR